MDHEYSHDNPRRDANLESNLSLDTEEKMIKQIVVIILFWTFYVIVPATIAINAIRIFIKAWSKRI